MACRELQQAVGPPPEDLLPVGGPHERRFLRRWADFTRLDDLGH
jgi:hypothetical protein